MATSVNSFKSDRTVEENGKKVVYLNLNDVPPDSLLDPRNSHSSGDSRKPDTSIHSANITDNCDLPISEIVQPLPITLCQDKINGIIQSLQTHGIDSVPPVDIMWVKGRQGGNYYFAFGCSQRIEAHCRLGLSTIKAKLIPSTTSDLKNYLGASTPDLL